MATHVNFAAIVPAPGGKWDVAIARGVMSSGNPEIVKMERIALNLDLEQAGAVVRAAPFIMRLDFYEYAPAEAR